MKKIGRKPKTCMNPLVIEDHNNGIFSVHSDCIENTQVNVDDAVCLREKQRQKFKESLPKECSFGKESCHFVKSPETYVGTANKCL